MNIFDRIVSMVSPKAGAERMFYRQLCEEYRSYDAADRGRLNRNWAAINQPAEYEDRYDRDIIRARARDLERNSDIGNSLISAYKRNIMGAGYTLRAQTGDEDLNKQIEDLWKKWCKAKNCDVTGTQSFNQMMRMAAGRKKVDGGILFKKCYTDGGLLPFKLQAIEVDELDSSCTKTHAPGNSLCGGIEYDRHNRAVGYYIREYSLDNWQVKDPVYVKAEDIIFYFTKNRPSQVREMSDMSPVLTRIKEVNEYITTFMTKERVEAAQGIFIKKNPAAPLGPGRHITEENTGYAVKRITPGMIHYLNAGEEIQPFTPSGQGQNATTTIKLFQRLIGAGQGLSYEATSRDMSETNYSSAREGRIEDDETYIADKELLLETVFDGVYETFILSAVLCGRITISGFWDNRDLYMSHEWIRRPKPWVDPQKEANANKIAMQSGQKTFKEICAENGKDYKEQIDDIVEALEHASSKNFDLAGILFGQPESVLYEGDEEDGEDKKQNVHKGQ